MLLYGIVAKNKTAGLEVMVVLGGFAQMPVLWFPTLQVTSWSMQAKADEGAP